MEEIGVFSSVTGKFDAHSAHLYGGDTEGFQYICYICAVHPPAGAGLGGNGLGQEFQLPVVAVLLVKMDWEQPFALGQGIVVGPVVDRMERFRVSFPRKGPNRWGRRGGISFQAAK